MKRFSTARAIVYKSAAFCLLLVWQAIDCNAQLPCIAMSLKCENLINPLGIDAATPRLSWHLQDDRTGATQTACQVFVSTDSMEIIEGKGKTWQTRIISPDQTIIYKGKTLLPF